MPRPPARKTGKKVAVVGSGPGRPRRARSSSRAPATTSTVFEKNDRIGGLLRYGIPDFKMEKSHIDRRVEQMEAEGVEFRTGVQVGDAAGGQQGHRLGEARRISADELLAEFDAVVLAGGAEQPRDLPVPGRDLDGVHFAMEFLPQQNKVSRRRQGRGPDLRADGKHVVVIGGGDTGSDCVGTSNRHGAASVTQFELLPQPPEQENKPLVWPYWPIKLRTSSSHEEGCERDFAIATKEFIGEKRQGQGAEGRARRMEGRQDGRSAGHRADMPADLVLLAMGFVSPVRQRARGLRRREGRARQRQGAAPTSTAATRPTSPKVFAAGDMRRGQSLVVWAIREGRQAARAVDEFLMGSSDLPR